MRGYPVRFYYAQTADCPPLGCGKVNHRSGVEGEALRSVIAV
jgi:hypothetical protein